jgi:hypothetical protein
MTFQELILEKAACVVQWLERRVQRSNDPCIGGTNPTVVQGVGLSDEAV